VRERAQCELRALGGAARPALRELLAGKPSAEARRRAEQALAELERTGLPPHQVRQRRAVEALEAAGTPAARRVLQALAGGKAEPFLARQAQAALRRLAGARAKPAGVGAPNR
jgi:hypothetical protein